MEIRSRAGGLRRNKRESNSFFPLSRHAVHLAIDNGEPLFHFVYEVPPIENVDYLDEVGGIMLTRITIRPFPPFSANAN